MCRPKFPDDRVRFDEYEMWVFGEVPKCGSTDLRSQKPLWQNSQALLADRRVVPQSEASATEGGHDNGLNSARLSTETERL